MTESAGEKKIIIDACVLIDFVKADISIFQSITQFIGQLHVISTVMEEVHDIRQEEQNIPGLIIIEPELEDASLAYSVRMPISSEDYLCLLTAKRHGLICITNDSCLRRECEKQGIPIIWGLGLLLELHERKGIQTEKAKEIAEKIHENNPKYITKSILADFIKKISS